jgi:hypothetical protein
MTYQSTWYWQQDDLAVAPRSLLLTSYWGNIMTGNMEYIYNMEGVIDKLNMR